MSFRSRYSRLPAHEIDRLLREHTVKRSMAFFDRLSPEHREMVRTGAIPLTGHTWQIQDRDDRGRFRAVMALA